MESAMPEDSPSAEPEVLQTSRMWNQDMGVETVWT
jgi:hypothetical protein